MRLLLCHVPWVVAAALSTAFSDGVRPKLFVERDGVVAMEAEHATRAKGWKPVKRDDASGVAMVDDGGRLAFVIKIKRPGRYFVWFRHAKPAGAGDKSNDCIVSVGGKGLEVHDGEKSHRVIGMGTHQKALAFESRPKTHESKLRAYHPHFVVPRPAVVEFKVISRSPGYLLDKIVLIHEAEGGDEAKPEAIGDLKGTGPAETAHR